jgi:hypothetical protein
MGDEAREGARKHDAAQQSRGHQADDPALLLARHEERRHRHHHLRGRGAHAQHDAAEEEDARAGGGGDRRQREDHADEGQQHQAPVLEAIGERHHQREAEAAAELRQGDGGAREFAREADVGADLRDERLAEVVVGDQHTAGDRQQRDDRPASL